MIRRVSDGLGLLIWSFIILKFPDKCDPYDMTIFI